MFEQLQRDLAFWPEGEWIIATAGTFQPFVDESYFKYIPTAEEVAEEAEARREAEIDARSARRFSELWAVYANAGGKPYVPEECNAYPQGAEW